MTDATGGPSLESIEQLVASRIAGQGGVPSYYDNFVRTLLRSLREQATDSDLAPGDVIEELRRFEAAVAAERFVDPRPRLQRSRAETIDAMGVGWIAYKASQGLRSVIAWRGLPLFKTVYDLATYPMLLAELRPRTIVELGSGCGASASWIADAAATHGLSPRVISVDKNPVAVDDRRVQFIRGDITRLDDILDRALLDSLARPWILIEDAHVNVGDVLRLFDRHANPGDYLIVEDSLPKRDDLRAFLDASANAYALDTAYTDMFGENTTCAVDSILKRV